VFISRLPLCIAQRHLAVLAGAIEVALAILLFFVVPALRGLLAFASAQMSVAVAQVALLTLNAIPSLLLLLFILLILLILLLALFRLSSLVFLFLVRHGYLLLPIGLFLLGPSK
jgi:hypothetical protein